MSYGFDPSELIETKVDLIDKDGFHGVGTADGENGGGLFGFQPEEGVYFFRPSSFSRDDYDITVIAILDKEHHPEIFTENDYSIAGRTTGWRIYQSEMIDPNDMTYDEEDYCPYYNGEQIGIALGGTGGAIETKDWLLLHGQMNNHYHLFEPGKMVYAPVTIKFNPDSDNPSLMIFQTCGIMPDLSEE